MRFCIFVIILIVVDGGAVQAAIDAAAAKALAERAYKHMRGYLDEVKDEPVDVVYELVAAAQKAQGSAEPIKLTAEDMAKLMKAKDLFNDTNASFTTHMGRINILAQNASEAVKAKLGAILRLQSEKSTEFWEAALKKAENWSPAAKGAVTKYFGVVKQHNTTTDQRSKEWAQFVQSLPKKVQEQVAQANLPDPHVYFQQLRAAAEQAMSGGGTAEAPCADAPSLTDKYLCVLLLRWDTKARTFPPVPPKYDAVPVEELAKKGAATVMRDGKLHLIAENINECMDLGCFCFFVGGKGQLETNNCTLKNGKKMQRAVRKEYRQMSDEEREKFHAALNTVKKNGAYDELAKIHNTPQLIQLYATANGGPGFLFWHREYLKRMEFTLRQVDPTVSLPYFDYTLDVLLPEPADSIMWTKKFAGTSDKEGFVTDGPFADWKTLEGNPHIRRYVTLKTQFSTGERVGSFPSDADIRKIIEDKGVERVFGYASGAPNSCRADPTVKYKTLMDINGNAYLFVGSRNQSDCGTNDNECIHGDMSNIFRAVNDPVFWMTQLMPDMVFEQWLKKFSNEERKKLYPADLHNCSAQQHGTNMPLNPFWPLKNGEASTSLYTDNLYEFAPRPSCDMGPDCGSEYLFCDKSHGKPRCSTKVKQGGNCTGFTNGEAVCIDGKCNKGKCVRDKYGY